MKLEEEEKDSGEDVIEENEIKSDVEETKEDLFNVNEDALKGEEAELSVDQLAVRLRLDCFVGIN